MLGSLRRAVAATNAEQLALKAQQAQNEFEELTRQQHQQEALQNSYNKISDLITALINIANLDFTFTRAGLGITRNGFLYDVHAKPTQTQRAANIKDLSLLLEPAGLVIVNSTPMNPVSKFSISIPEGKELGVIISKLHDLVSDDGLQLFINLRNALVKEYSKFYTLTPEITINAEGVNYGGTVAPNNGTSKILDHIFKNKTAEGYKISGFEDIRLLQAVSPLLETAVAAVEKIENGSILAELVVFKTILAPLGLAESRAAVAALDVLSNSLKNHEIGTPQAVIGILKDAGMDNEHLGFIAKRNNIDLNAPDWAKSVRRRNVLEEIKAGKDSNPPTAQVAP